MHIFRALADDPWALLVPQGSLLAQRGELSTPHELERHTLLAPTASAAFRRIAPILETAGWPSPGADTLAHNEASCRVACKAGYTLEGTQRRQGLHADGWHDMHLHARLHDDIDSRSS